MADSRFDPSSIDAFHFVDYDWDDPAARARLRYALDDLVFEEIVEFESTEGRRFGTDTAAFASCLRYLHLAAGVSYYKAAAPAQAVVASGGLTAGEREFFTRLYDDGLREFAYVNRMPVPTGPELVAEDASPRAAGPVDLPARAAIPLGGGKDSVVVAAALAHLKPLLVTVNGNSTSAAVAERSGLGYVQVRRRLSPRLLELNHRGALNGHVPITAIVSLTSALGGFLYGYDTVVMANERSASAPTRVVDGYEVNHQYSKGGRFERDLAGLLAAGVSPSVRCFSLLRPYSELAVGRAVAGLDAFHGVFQSCNANFRRDWSGGQHRWCNDCPKCRFVFLIMAPFMDPGDLTAIFGENLLDDPGQIEGYTALSDTGERRPFECVGEPTEIMAALALLGDRPAWRDSAVVAALLPRAQQGTAGVDIERLFAPSDDHDVPPSYLDAIARLMNTPAPSAAH